jgi:UDP-2,3-diacylglucosamine pyrophosphatase LpxH
MQKYITPYYNIFSTKEPPYNLYFLGDFHLRSLMHYQKLFMKMRDHIKKDKRALILFVGDMFESDSSTIRHRKSALYADRSLNYLDEDNDVDTLIKEKIIPILDFITPKNCIGMLDGNHYRQFSDNLTDTQKICVIKGLPYLGLGETNIFLKFRLGTSQSTVVRIRAYHSYQNSGADSADITKLMNKVKSIENFDIIVKAHTHNPLIKPIEKEVADEYTPLGSRLKTIWIVNTASTRKFRDKYTDYSESANYNPLAYQIPYISFKLVTENSHKYIGLDGKYLSLLEE